MKKKLMKELNFFVPITRVDEEKRIVEGIAFANEVVEGEGGVRLKASAMEADTANYMKFGTVRAMHQPSAAGTATPNDPELARECGVFWMNGEDYDANRPEIAGKRVAVLRSYISDDSDWKKAQDGTYKGYSVGVLPRVMRGKSVESCTWIETSLVDRPKDPDALLTTVRVDDAPEECEVEIHRASFAEYLEGYAPGDLRDMALDYLWMSLLDIQYGYYPEGEGTPDQKAAQIKETCDQFAEFMIGALATGEIPNLNAVDGDEAAERSVGMPLLTRFIEVQGGHDDLLQRIATIEAENAEIQRAVTEKDETISALTIERDNSSNELTRVQGLYEAAEERVKKLENEPARVPPVRVPQAVERTFGAQDAEQVKKAKELRDEYLELSRMEPSRDPKTADQRVSRMQVLKRELQSLGEAV